MKEQPQSPENPKDLFEWSAQQVVSGREPDSLDDTFRCPLCQGGAGYCPEHQIQVPISKNLSVLSAPLELTDEDIESSNRLADQAAEEARIQELERKPVTPDDLEEVFSPLLKKLQDQKDQDSRMAS